VKTEFIMKASPCQFAGFIGIDDFRRAVDVESRPVSTVDVVFFVVFVHIAFIAIEVSLGSVPKPIFLISEVQKRRINGQF